MRLFIIFLLLLYPFTPCNATEDYSNYDKDLDQLIDSMQIESKSIEILIDKSSYKLTLKSGKQVLKEYPVVFGGNPEDDKLREGDQCTPEGDFKIISKYPHRSWSKFIWISYPSPQSWEKHNKAKEEFRIPEDAKIGGEIGIHGVPTGMDYLIDTGYNWTLGCISMKNKDVNEIYPYITKETKIHIRK